MPRHPKITALELVCVIGVVFFVLMLFGLALAVYIRSEVRRAVADYMRSEGCSCCRDIPAHELNTEHLAELLRVPKYDDSSGFDFAKFRSKP